MLELILVVAFGGLALRNTRVVEDELSVIPRKISDQLSKLWSTAHQGMRENRFLRAEKALLTILKIDKKNATAYNRLGILYAKQKEYKDSIDCFEIASSIEPTASSLHNLGLIYCETENYSKAATAFEQALKLEEELAARHIAYAKALEKLGNEKLMFDELNRAAELEPTKETLGLLHKVYETRGMHAEADIMAAKLKKVASKQPRSKPVNQPRRVIV